MTDRRSRLRGLSRRAVLPMAIATILGSSSPGVALAQTTSEKLKICDSAAKVAVAVTAARDAGIPKADVEKQVLEMVTDSDQKLLLQAIVGLTYAMDGVEAPLMQEVTLQMCQKRTGLK
jgi:hypothetical protein